MSDRDLERRLARLEEATTPKPADAALPPDPELEALLDALLADKGLTREEMRSRVPYPDPDLIELLVYGMSGTWRPRGPDPIALHDYP